jgi:hypothetical protein
MKRYPDVSELLALKAERRQRLAKLSVQEKMQITDRLRQASQEIPKLMPSRKQTAKVRTAKAGKRW